MNHTYRLIWSAETQRYMAAPETAKGRGKSKCKALAPAAVVLAASLALPVWAQAPPANALPTGAVLQAGQAQMSQVGHAMTVKQSSAKAIIDWTSFDIGKNASVTFQQPDASAVALNRVMAGDASQIHGQLNANGQVWLLNPQGVVFGSTSRVDVGALVASTLDIRNQDFLDGQHTLRSHGATGSVHNQGSITAKDGGHVALLAPAVHNDGVITAQLGTVALVAGDTITLQTGDHGLLNIQVDPATLATLVENKQLIVADGGQVIMTGKAADALAASVVANTGVIQSNRLQERDGKILLVADMLHGETTAAGQLQAAFVETSAATVKLDADLKVDTAGGQWLIDPVDITIDAGKAAAIEYALGTGDVTISTADGASNGSLGTNASGSAPGDIYVNAGVTYAQNKLTLHADNDIHLNAAIQVNGSGTLALNYGGTQGNSHTVAKAGSNLKAQFAAEGGFAGKVDFAQAGAGLLAINGVDYTIIQDMDALKAIQSNPNGAYALGRNIDASGTWDFSPIQNFSGTLDGLGHTVQQLQISRGGDNMGLFATTNNAALRNIGLDGGSFYAGYGNYTGALVGRANNTRITHAYSTASVTNSDYQWGWFTGGLVGWSEGSSISQSYASGTISGNWFTGGLVGRSVNSAISQSYATGSVTGRSGGMGGLVGSSIGGSKIEHSYATGNVYGYGSVGGLVGHLSTDAQISQSFATGKVAHDPNGSSFGGLVGEVEGGVNHRITNAFYASTNADGSSNGNAAGAGGVAKTWAELADPLTFAGWDRSIWGTAATLGAAVEGYATGSHLFLNHVSRAQDTQYNTLFDGGWGTADSAYGIASWSQLDNVRQVLGNKYVFQLNSNLNSSSVGYDILASATANSGAGWEPLGNGSRAFSGTFDGQGYTISDVQIVRPGQDYVGLFGQTSGAVVQNVGLENARIQGQNFVGALSGSNWDGTVRNAYATGQVQGAHAVGGLVGQNVAYGFGHSASISGAYADVQVSGNGQGVGNGVGLGIGRGIGGLVGQNVGDTGGEASITDAYALGSTTGQSHVGGLLGYNRGSSYGQAQVRNTYAAGRVTGSGNDVGGLVGLGEHESTVTASFWNTETSAQVAGIGGGNAGGMTGANTVQLQQLQTFTAAGWDVDDVGGSGKVWRIYDSYTAPLLRSFLKATTVDTAARSGDLGSKTYDGSSANVLIDRQDYMVSQGVVLQGLGLRYVSTSKNAGSYSTANDSLRLQGLYSGQQGYDIAYLTGAASTFTIHQAELSISGTTVADRQYNGDTDARSQTTLGSWAPGAVLGQDQVSLGIDRAVLDSKNAGSRTATVTYTLSGEDAANYVVADSTHTGVQMTPKALTVSGITADAKTYDGMTTALVHADHVVLAGLVQGDQLRVAATGQFTDKNAGVGKTVTLTSTYSGADVGNYRITDQAMASADIDSKALDITVHSVSKMQGESLNWSGREGFTVGQGLVNGETISEVTLTSLGADAQALAGNYSIVASDAVGTQGFDRRNYDISYHAGLLTVNQHLPEGGSLWRAQLPQANGPATDAGTNLAPMPMPGSQHQAGNVPFLSMMPNFIQAMDAQ